MLGWSRKAENAFVTEDKMRIRMGELQKEGYEYHDYRVIWNQNIDRDLKIKFLRAAGVEFVKNSLKYWDSLPSDDQRKIIKVLNDYLEVSYVKTDY